ncbi:6125_t:CDS:2, partial [Funneliformis caledonium]
LTFARIFTNVETAQAYQNLFEDLFGCIERDTNETFNFYHIHQKGLGCIIADQHKGQALAWTKDKLIPWVLSGISGAFTKMNQLIWNQIPNNTNVGESAHANVNHDGRNLSFLAEVMTLTKDSGK